MAWPFFIMVAVIVGAFAHGIYIRTTSTPAEWQEYLHGPINPPLICPHCQTKGFVHVKAATDKAGISGDKATAALLTGGVSLLATGLSQNRTVTQAHCSRCQSDWKF
jgi:hypothetical protein